MIVVRCETVAGYAGVDGSDTIHIRGTGTAVRRSPRISKGRCMPKDDPTPQQRSVLLILMAEARELPNAHLTNHYRVELKKGLRDDLVRRGLIKVRLERSRVHFELTERGWFWCSEEDGTEVPSGMGHGGAVAYAMLAGLQRNLRHLGRATVSELFARLDEPVVAGEPVPTDIEAQIRKAYQELATGPSASVKLADLRGLLGGVARSDVDRALIEMNRLPDVSIVPESDQKLLTDQDRAAAVQIGNQDKHLITVGP
jgi:hypothetical protein